MGLIKEAKRIKKIHPNYLILYKSGAFYKAFGKDAYLLGMLLDYDIRIVNNNVAMCGFPLKSSFKVRTKIEDKEINYMIIEPRNNYDVEIKEDFGNLNEYDRQFKKAYSQNKRKKKISHISEELTLLIENSFNEVKRNTRNERRVFNMKQYKAYYISTVYDLVTKRNYTVGPYNKFTIYEPKERLIVSQSVIDKIVNHLVARYILYPAILPCLLDVNVASRKNLGTSAGLNIAKEYRRICKVKYRTYYILKCDISKFFASINHNRLKEKIRKRIKDKEALDIIYKIIDSSEPGLFIGSMTSQVLAIFYLNDLDYFIKEVLKVKNYVRYQDDFMLFHQSKDYLKYCYKEIEKFLKKEGLSLNKKTRIFKNTDNYIFLGRNTSNQYTRYRRVKRKLKEKNYRYSTGQIPLNSIVSSVTCYEGLLKNKPNFLYN